MLLYCATPRATRWLRTERHDKDLLDLLHRHSPNRCGALSGRFQCSSVGGVELGPPRGFVKRPTGPVGQIAWKWWESVSPNAAPKQSRALEQIYFLGPRCQRRFAWRISGHENETPQCHTMDGSRWRQAESTRISVRRSCGPEQELWCTLATSRRRLLSNSFQPLQWTRSWIRLSCGVRGDCRHKQIRSASTSWRCRRVRLQLMERRRPSIAGAVDIGEGCAGRS